MTTENQPDARWALLLIDPQAGPGKESPKCLAPL
jgi:hypothetical protein